MSKSSLLVNRLLMAQGAIALFEKNIKDALTLAREYDKVRSTSETGDQEQEPPWLNEYGEVLQEELPW